MIDLKVFDTFQIPYVCLAPPHTDQITRAAKSGAGIIIRGGIAQGGPDAEIQRPLLNKELRQRIQERVAAAIEPSECRNGTCCLRLSAICP